MRTPAALVKLRLRYSAVGGTTANRAEGLTNVPPGFADLDGVVPVL